MSQSTTGDTDRRNGERVLFSSRVSVKGPVTPRTVHLKDRSRKGVGPGDWRGEDTGKGVLLETG